MAPGFHKRSAHTELIGIHATQPWLFPTFGATDVTITSIVSSCHSLLPHHWAQYLAYIGLELVESLFFIYKC